jgi:hypothetical protein
MTWKETMKEHAKDVSRNHVSNDAIVNRGTSVTSWDPHEVWLKRVRQPRERAASGPGPRGEGEGGKRRD